MDKYFRDFLSAILTAFLTIVLTTCGGGGGSSHVSSISNLNFSPGSAALNEGGGSVSVTGFIDFVDDGGDISSVTIKAWDTHSTLVTDITISVSGATGTSGTLQGLVSVGTTEPGSYSIEIFCTDSHRSRSNTLSGTFDILESLKTTGYANLRLREFATGFKQYYFQIQVTNPDGSMLTDKSLIQDVKLYDYPSMTEVPLTNPWVLWHSPYYRDEDGNGGNLPAQFPWSEVIGIPNVSVGSLGEGFYKGVVTDSLGGQHEVWLYYEIPVEADRVQGASMNVNDNGDGTVTLSWTNPGNINPAKHIVYVYVNTTTDTGDGYDDLLLQVVLPTTDNSYIIPASEVTRLNGFTGLYWFVLIREQVTDVTNPDSSVKDYFIYRNYSPEQALNLP
jgi:hypothetical protein